MTAAVHRPRIFLAYTADELERYYSPGALQALEALGEVVRNDTGEVIEKAALADAARGCDIVIAHRSVGVDAAFFEKRDPRVRAVIRGAMDVSTIDVDAATRAGVVVANTSSGFERAVAEHAIALAIDVARDMTRAREAFLAGTEQPTRQGMELGGATLGVVGMGRIGRELARLASALGMRVVYADPSAEAPYERLEFAELLATADVVACLAVSVPETRGLFDDAAFGSMKRGAIFLNLSRGELVDEAALERALDAGILRGAGLDVGSGLDQTPPLRLARRPDVVATPHSAGMTAAARHVQAMDTVDQARQIVAGRIPDRAVNGSALA
ncbi:2-hydroxyacid dehydrogenase [Microbacterium nanhaiense]|uniref:2-hydroxyacid dehydrogenase n=1 Tax=Microbacterium nanhaiense TaxID=1301026 RepID=A0ABQ2N0U5_9MICO|nr:NAD(P)-dependent oxidoreductase [Microbacterium nanhaiense]GGO63721.1 2-hydroxyacid dehydrogenase [Microbacterium nanhaiense]